MQQALPKRTGGLFVPRPNAEQGKKEDEYEVIEVPSVDLEIAQWSMNSKKLKPGQDIKITVTIRNLGGRRITDKMLIRVERDPFFQSIATEVNKPIPPTGEINVEVTLKVQGGITNLNTLPKTKELLLVKELEPGKLAKLSSLSIVIPIAPFIRYLKEEFPTIHLQLWGLMGTGKSSFINSLATLYNEDHRFPNKKLSPAFSRPSSSTVTKELKQYQFDNVVLRDAWGWEEARQEVYNDLLFQLMLGGRLGSNFSMEDAPKVNVLKLPTNQAEPIELVLFFVTTASVQSEVYLNMLNHFIKEAQKLDVPFLVLLTQIDKVDLSLRQDPYCINPTVQELVSQICMKIELNEDSVVPVVNYTKEAEREWAMDRAAFVTLYRAFQAREESRMGLGEY